MPHLITLVASYGYTAAFVLLFLESLGLPAPGEGVLIATALFAARTHRLDISAIVATAATAAFLGKTAGYILGRSLGQAFLNGFGGYIGLSPARRLLGQYLFLRHGGKIVFLGRFVAILRTFAGLLAGTNRMPWRPFLLFNALGALVWTMTIAFGAFYLGRTFIHISRPAGIAAVALAGLALLAAIFYVRKQEASLQRLADAALN